LSKISAQGLLPFRHTQLKEKEWGRRRLDRRIYPLQKHRRAVMWLAFAYHDSRREGQNPRWFPLISAWQLSEPL